MVLSKELEWELKEKKYELEKLRYEALSNRFSKKAKLIEDYLETVNKVLDANKNFS